MSQTALERIRLSEFARTPYLNVLTYPVLDIKVARSRLEQLEELGVEEVVFEGRTKIGRLGLVGIGTVSGVVRGVIGGRVHAVKIRRADANRESMLEEYRLTEIANRIGVGAQAFAATRDFMVMQLVDGEDLEDHLRAIRGVGTRARVREILHLLLNQCRKLVLIDLDHGQQVWPHHRHSQHRRGRHGHAAPLPVGPAPAILGGVRTARGAPLPPRAHGRGGIGSASPHRIHVTGRILNQPAAALPWLSGRRRAYAGCLPARPGNSQ